MKKKTLTLNRKTDQSAKPIDQKSGPFVEADPEKRLLNGVAVHPSPGIRLELGSAQPSARAMDLITPIGMGQRGLIVAPPGAGKSTLLKHICQAIEKEYPEVKLYALLIDERPEEVTDFKRSVPAEVTVAPPAAKRARGITS